MIFRKIFGYFTKTIGQMAIFSSAMLWTILCTVGHSQAAPPDSAERASQNGTEDVSPAAIFAEAVKAAKGIGANWNAGGDLCNIAGEQAKAGLFDDALATARAIEFRDSRVVALQWIAGAQCRTGLLKEALATAREIEVPSIEVIQKEIASNKDGQPSYREGSQQHAASRKAWTLGTVAAAMAKAGQADLARKTLEEAFTTAEQLDDYDRASALCEVAATQAEAKLVEQTSQACVKAMGASKEVYDQVLEDITKSQMEAGLLAEAIATARKFKEGRGLMLLCQIAVEQAKAGQEAEARKTFVETLSMANVVSEWKDEILFSIGRAQIEAGFCDDALTTCERIKKSEGKTIVLEELGEAQIKAGKLAEALETARKIGGGKRDGIITKVDLFGQIAVQQAKQGKMDQARKTFAESLNAAKQCKDVSGKSLAFCNISEFQTECREVKQARETLGEALAAARKIEAGENKAWTMSVIAVAQAKAGDKDGAHSTFAEASKVIDKLEMGQEKESVICRLVSQEVEAGFFAEATAFVRANPKPEFGDYLPSGLEDVAEGQIKAGQADQARKTYEEAIIAARATDYAHGFLCSIAISQAKSGFLAESLATAREITDAGKKAEALCGIGTELTKKKN
jgi:tetratricopeptide (TPR) repeat protein